MQDLGTWSGPYYPFWPYYGYVNLGPTPIPPLVPIVGMTDRATGTIYYLTFDPVPNRIALVTVDFLSGFQKLVTRVYGPFDGPYIQSQGLRLGIRNGRVVFDTSPGNSGSGPWAVNLSNSKSNWHFLYGQSIINNNSFDHLAFDHIVSWLSDEQGEVLGDDPDVDVITLDNAP